MLLPRSALVCSLLVLAVMPACQGKSTTPAPVAEVKATPAPVNTKANALASEAKVGDPEAADGGPSPAEVAAVEAGRAPAPSQGPVAALQDDPKASGAAGDRLDRPPELALGAHLVDPSWFRKTMFGDAAKVLDTKRTQADEQGRFSSLIRFELTDMKPESCADHLQGLVKDEVPNLERKTTPQGRVQLTGNTDRYKLTFQCGEAQGKTIAYVSYQWT
jgi:hypothetical protein